MSEVEVLHQALLQRTQGVFSLPVAVTQAAATPRLPAVPDAIPVAAEDDEEPAATDDDGLRMGITEESRENIQRAPVGTRFFCVADTEGTTHCAVSQYRNGLDDSQKSSLGGVALEPIVHGYGGTGHQQVARAAGIDFDEATARVGYVDGEGYGMSIEKVSECERNYSFRSAFNRTSNPEGSRELPGELAERFEEAIEQAFPACGLTGDPDAG